MASTFPNRTNVVVETNKSWKRFERAELISGAAAGASAAQDSANEDE